MCVSVVQGRCKCVMGLRTFELVHSFQYNFKSRLNLRGSDWTPLFTIPFKLVICLTSVMRFQLFTAATGKNSVFWDVMQCSLVDVYRHHGRAYCLRVKDNVYSIHRRTFSARPRVGMCRQCARPSATNVRHSGRVRATMRLMSVFLFRIEGRSCSNTRKHERPDYTSRAAQSPVSKQSEQLSRSEVTS
jgi:hypothetical protein